MTHNPLAYPAACRDDQVDDYHGVKVADPYRWLEDADSPETRAWIEAQNAVTEAYLSTISARERIRTRLTELWDYEKYGVPFKEGGRYFYTHNDGLQNQSVLYVAPSYDAEGSMLLDPNTLSPDGTVALSGLSVCRDGSRMAYSLASAGSDWQEWHVRDVGSGLDLADHLRWSKFSGASWLPDGSGFFYCRYATPEPGQEFQAANYNQKLCFHRLGTPQDEDPIVYERPDHKEWGFGHFVTDDNRYLVMPVWQGTEPTNRLFYIDLTAEPWSVVELVPEDDASYDFVGNDGPVFVVRTDLDAPMGRVIAIDAGSPDRSRWRTVIPEVPQSLQGASWVGGKLFCTYLKDAHTAVRVHSLDGVLERTVALPGVGSAFGFGGKQDNPETFYFYASFTQPDSIYRYDTVAGESALVRQAKVAARTADYETVQVFVTSKDGTRVPMFITQRKGIVLDGTHPTLLTGYGGFRISLTPSYSPSAMAWLEMGGVYAVPNLRGGFEYGASWHDAGRLANKQNVFDDFIAAAEWLIREGYTTTPKLAIAGGSNGGLLVGACMTQRPDLFGACLPAVGVMDMLRFHKFTIGWGWVSDYGSSDEAEQFGWLYAYSPLHNIRPGTAYPATLITTGDHDDRVVPAHSFKFAAALQAAQAGPAPVLIRVETRAGHGAGKPTALVIAETADRWTFLAKNLGLDAGD